MRKERGGGREKKSEHVDCLHRTYVSCVCRAEYHVGEERAGEGQDMAVLFLSVANSCTQGQPPHLCGQVCSLCSKLPTLCKHLNVSMGTHYVLRLTSTMFNRAGVSFTSCSSMTLTCCLFFLPVVLIWRATPKSSEAFALGGLCNDAGLQSHRCWLIISYC